MYVHLKKNNLKKLRHLIAGSNVLKAFNCYIQLSTCHLTSIDTFFLKSSYLYLNFLFPIVEFICWFPGYCWLWNELWHGDILFEMFQGQITSSLRQNVNVYSFGYMYSCAPPSATLNQEYLIYGIYVPLYSADFGLLF